MNDFLKFLSDNWQVLTSVVVFILSFILLLIKKAPVTDIFSWIYKSSIKAINEVEVLGVKGSDKKLAFAVSVVLKRLIAAFPNLNSAQYIKIVTSVIEDILSTPQKKGGNVDG